MSSSANPNQKNEDGVMSRKSLIMAKAIELFARNGIEATTVQDITEACGISKGAFYLSFESKDDLITAIIDDFLQDIVAKNNALLREPLPARELLFRYMFSYLNVVYEHAPFLTLFLRERINPLNDRMLQRIRELEMSSNDTLLTIIGKLYGPRATAIQYDLLVTIQGLIKGYMEFVVRHPQAHDLEALARFLVERVDCLVEHHPYAYITPEMWSQKTECAILHEPTKESVRQLIASFRGSYAELPLVEETLQLLAEELAAPEPREALVQGLLSNLMPYKEFAFLVYQVNRVLRK